MDLSKIPKPIVYALAFVIFAIGGAAAYQVGVGSSLEYDGALGSIKVGSGENETTLASFLDESEQALAVAQDTIKEQDTIIGRLRSALKKYQTETNRLKSLSERLSSAQSQAQRAEIRDQLQVSTAAITSEDARVLQSTDLRALDAAKIKINAQASRTREISREISR